MTIRFDAPLQWPDWPLPTARNNQRSDSGFASMTLEESIGYLQQEVIDLGASGSLSTDIDQPLVERLRRKVGSRSGAVLRLRWQGELYVLACDKWMTLEHNIYALHLAMRQWRNIERWGVGNMQQLLKGYHAGAAPSQSSSTATSGGVNPPWMDELGLGPTSTLEDAVAIYHRRAKNASHDTEALTRLNILMDEVRTYFASKKS